MTECDKIQGILPAYLEGLASPTESEMVSSHLVCCPQCNSTVRALMKSQKLVTNLEEVEPPTWLKTRIMARLEEVEQEDQKGWDLGRLRGMLLYPLKIKIPFQVFAVLLVAVTAVYVYRLTQPELRITEQSPKNIAAVPARTEKKDLLPKAEGEQKTGEQASIDSRQPRPESQPQSPAKLAPEEAGRWPSGIREIFKSGQSQPSPSPALKMPQETTKDQETALQTAAEPETRKKEKAASAKLALPSVIGRSGASSTVAPMEDRIRSGYAKMDAEKGKSAFPGVSQETLALTVQVTDLKTGTNDVEAVLRNLGAPVARELKEGSIMINTEVAPSKAKEIIRRLSAVGQVQQKSQYPETASDKPVSVRIQVLPKQP